MPILIQCPFFKGEKGLRLHCEGGTVRSPDSVYRRELLMNYCASAEGWRKCTIAKNLDAFYDRQK